jgi:hypothetical protein
MQQFNPLAMVNQTPPDGKAVPDPRMMHKWGEESQYVHNVDAQAWAAQGWSHEVPLEPPATVDESENSELKNETAGKSKAKPKTEP